MNYNYTSININDCESDEEHVLFDSLVTFLYFVEVF